jgi:uncharacterized delta-60 repeat protein
MKEAAGRISRRVSQIAGQPARMSFKSAEASCVVVRDKISRSGGNGIFASLAHNRLPWAHALLSAIACTCLFHAGCGGGGSINPPSALKIGPAGGTVTESSGAKVVIPAGALTQDTPIAVTQTSAGAPQLPAGVTAFGPIYAFTPHGTSFAVPVTITVPFDPASVPKGTTLALYKTDATQKTWEVVSGASANGSLMSGQVTGFSYTVVALKYYGPIRHWQFSVDDNLEGLLPFGPGSSQDDFVAVSDGVDLGQVPGLSQNARMDVFSSANGFTYWTTAQAPHVDDLSVRGVLIGSWSELRTDYLLYKKAADAKFQLVVSAATLQLNDTSPIYPTYAQCPWSPGQDRFDCERVMQAEVNFEVTLDNISLNKGTPIAGGWARLQGWNDNWHIQAGSAGVGRAIWEESSFNLAVTAGSVTASLPKQIVVDVPLDSVGVGEVFAVNVNTLSHASNHRQGESNASAFFRDPAHPDGIVVNATGVEPAPPDLLVDVPSVPVAGTCPVGASAAGGTVEFSAAAFREPEFGGGLGARVSVHRTGGSQGEGSVLVTTSDGTATAGSDYTATSAVVHFADGESGDQVVRIPLLADALEEPDETVNLTLSDPHGCVQLGSQQTAALTILDDDHPQASRKSFALGGTVAGLSGSGLVIKDLISGGTASPKSDGAFTLSSPGTVLDGTPYNVIVNTQPTSPDQSCTVANGTGSVSGADVTNISVSCVSSAPSGSLDPTFGSGGRVTTTIGYSPGSFDPKMGMALQTDGKILLVGATTLARFNPDGTLDTSFGTGGQVAVPFNQSGFDTAQDVAVQADGKIVVVGLTTSSVTFNDDFALARFNADGTLDTSFGSGGKVTTDFFGSVDQARRVRIMPDGKILVAGSAVKVLSSISSVRHFALARYNTDGSLDTRFGNGGKVDEAAGASFSLARGMAFQSDGKIVVAGSGAPDGVSARMVALTRLFGDGGTKPPGTRDDTFGPTGQGFDLTDLGIAPDSAGVDVAVLPDDTILAACEVSLTGHFQFAIASFDRDNNQRRPQPAFVTITDQSDVPMQMLLQSDGKAVIVGRSGDLSSNADMAIVRFNAGGISLDPSFGTNGVLTVDFFGGRDSAEAVVQQPDGKLVVGGFARVGAGIVFALARLTP